MYACMYVFLCNVYVYVYMRTCVYDCLCLYVDMYI